MRARSRTLPALVLSFLPFLAAPAEPKEKEKRRILEGIQPLPALEPNKA